MSLAAVLEALRRAGITASPLEIAEALWLAQHVTHSAPSPADADPGPKPVDDQSTTAVPSRRSAPPPDLVPIAIPSLSSGAAAIRTASVRAPGPLGLTNQRDIQRALRPLRKRAPSRRHQVLDDRATVAYIASTGIWLPVLRSARERWFDVVLAVDTSASMELWHHLGTALRDAIAQTGAFRDVRICRLTPKADGCTVETGTGGTPHSPRELIDGTGRRLFLVVTDGAAEGWHDGTATRTLAAWGATGPVAVLQPLPEAMWSRTGLPAMAARLTSTSQGMPNSRLRAVYRRRSSGMPIPVLGIEPTAITAWATLVAHPTTDVALAAAPAGTAATDPAPAGSTVVAADVLDSFRATASPAAFRLAVCLSLVPLSLPVMRLVQHVAVPGSNASALAEVVLGGLMSRAGPGSYEFREGIRDRLAGDLRRSEAATVLSAVSAWIADNAGLASRTFSALLPGVDGAETTAADHFAWVPPSVAARLGLGAPAARAANVTKTAVRTPRTIVATNEVGTDSDPEGLWAQAQRTGSPIVSPVAPDGTVEVTFVWRGEAETTSVGWGMWLDLDREPGTDLWHRSIRLPAASRTLYYLYHEGAEGLPRDDSGQGLSHIDPLNPRPYCFPADPDDPTDHESWASLLDLPDAPEQTWSTPRRDIPIEQHTLPSGRRLAVYRPPGEPPAEGFATLVVFDGWLARSVLRIQHTVDNLIAAGLIPPTLALFVPGTDADRDNDLTPASTATTEFVTGELLPWARRELGAGSDPARTVVAGQALGGLMAAHVGLSAPEVFGAVIAQSGSYWWPKPEDGEPGRLLRDYAERPRAELRFYLDVGDRETRTVAGGQHMLELTRQFRDVLTAKGYPVTYAEYPGAHDYVNWRDTLADGLLAVLRAG